MEKKGLSCTFYVTKPTVIKALFLLFVAGIEQAKCEVRENVAPIPKSPISRRLNLQFLKTFIETRAETITSTIETTAMETTTMENSLKCNVAPNDICELHCSGEINASINDKLAEQQIACSWDLLLLLTNCFFPDDALTPDTFAGAYNLNTLQIECPLKYIAKKTFEQPTLANLYRLSLLNTNLRDLTEETFEGLQELKVLRLINCDDSTNSQFKNVLIPLAKTLTQLTMSQSNEYDPRVWFGDVEYEKLYVLNLANNRFPRGLEENTFEHLKATQNLYLNNCEIEEIDSNIFLPIVATLSYLSLKNNRLKQLDVSFMEQVSGKKMTIELAFNEWHCSCSIEGLINAIQQQSIIFGESPTCKTPDSWLDWNLGDVTLNCDSTIVTEEPEATTTPDQETTIENPTTIYPTEPTTSTATPIPTPSRPPAPSEVKVLCTSSYGRKYNASVTDKDAIFEIQTLNSTSVEVIIQNNRNSFELVYFDDRKHRSSVPIRLRETISYLTHLAAYTFCLVPYYASNNNDLVLSPFNCRSHYMSAFGDEVAQATPSSSDNTLFVSLTILGIFLFMIMAGIATYFALRWRPIWLKGNKRVVRVYSKSPRVVLHPKTGRRKRVQFQSISTDDRPNCEDSNFDCELNDSISRPHTLIDSSNGVNNQIESIDYEKID